MNCIISNHHILCCDSQLTIMSLPLYYDTILFNHQMFFYYIIIPTEIIDASVILGTIFNILI